MDSKRRVRNVESLEYVLIGTERVLDSVCGKNKLAAISIVLNTQLAKSEAVAPASWTKYW